MTAQGNPEAQPKTHVGFSIGRWEGKTLVIETSRVNARYLNAIGVPLGSFGPIRRALHADG